ncbi:MAG TPA: hypothetical protein VLS49_03790 [Usitatibacter sp.]|nr:hypothetical protein [Usitatibacter sp.]
MTPDLKRNGPRLTLAASCHGCVYEHSEYYCIEDGNDIDSGHDVYCSNERAVSSAPALGTNGLRRVGDSTWQAPDWCPLLDDARSEFAAAIARRKP